MPLPTTVSDVVNRLKKIHTIYAAILWSSFLVFQVAVTYQWWIQIQSEVGSGSSEIVKKLTADAVTSVSSTTTTISTTVSSNSSGKSESSQDLKETTTKSTSAVTEVITTTPPSKFQQKQQQPPNTAEVSGASVVQQDDQKESHQHLQENQILSTSRFYSSLSLIPLALVGYCLDVKQSRFWAARRLLVFPLHYLVLKLVWREGREVGNWKSIMVAGTSQSTSTQSQLLQTNSAIIANAGTRSTSSTQTTSVTVPVQQSSVTTTSQSMSSSLTFLYNRLHNNTIESLYHMFLVLSGAICLILGFGLLQIATFKLRIGKSKKQQQRQNLIQNQNQQQLQQSKDNFIRLYYYNPIISQALIRLFRLSALTFCITQIIGIVLVGNLGNQQYGNYQYQQSDTDSKTLQSYTILGLVTMVTQIDQTLTSWCFGGNSISNNNQESASNDIDSMGPDSTTIKRSIKFLAIGVCMFITSIAAHTDFLMARIWGLKILDHHPHAQMLLDQHHTQTFFLHSLLSTFTIFAAATMVSHLLIALIQYFRFSSKNNKTQIQSQQEQDQDQLNPIISDFFYDFFSEFCEVFTEQVIDLFNLIKSVFKNILVWIWSIIRFVVLGPIIGNPNRTSTTQSSNSGSTRTEQQHQNQILRRILVQERVQRLREATISSSNMNQGQLQSIQTLNGNQILPDNSPQNRSPPPSNMNNCPRPRRLSDDSDSDDLQLNIKEQEQQALLGGDTKRVQVNKNIKTQQQKLNLNDNSDKSNFIGPFRLSDTQIKNENNDIINDLSSQLSGQSGISEQEMIPLKVTGASPYSDSVGQGGSGIDSNRERQSNLNLQSQSSNTNMLFYQEKGLDTNDLDQKKTQSSFSKTGKTNIKQNIADYDAFNFMKRTLSAKPSVGNKNSNTIQSQQPSSSSQTQVQQQFPESETDAVDDSQSIPILGTPEMIRNFQENISNFLNLNDDYFNFDEDSDDIDYDSLENKFKDPGDTDTMSVHPNRPGFFSSIGTKLSDAIDFVDDALVGEQLEAVVPTSKKKEISTKKLQGSSRSCTSSSSTNYNQSLKNHNGSSQNHRSNVNLNYMNNSKRPLPNNANSNIIDLRDDEF